MMVNNYRTVPVLPLVSNILERIMHNRLMISYINTSLDSGEGWERTPP